jgi:hypothetical protein
MLQIQVPTTRVVSPSYQLARVIVMVVFPESGAMLSFGVHQRMAITTVVTAI